MSDPTALGIGGLLEAFAAGELDAVTATRACLARIERLDGALGAWISLDPSAERQARDRDRRRARGDTAPLLGVPVAIKDNIATAGVRTTCGSRILERYEPARDASAVDRLRRAGAVILGKTNLDEFGMGSSTESSAFGPTRNPWNLGRVAGGSSGGSVVAVAAGMVPAALGSDTGGSLRQPAAFCGAVGVKPTYGRVSRSGLVAYGSSLDQIGCTGRSCEDGARVLEAIAGHDPADATSADRSVGRYAEACGRGVDGMRIGLPAEYAEPGLGAEVKDALLRAARALERGGARTEEISLPHTRFAIAAYYLIATAEASSNLARYDGVRYGLRCGADGAGGPDAMYRATRGAGFGDEVKRRVMLGTYALSAGYYDAYYGKAQRARTLIAADFDACFRAGIDAILVPTTPSPAFRLGSKIEDPLEMYLSDVFTVTANLAGLPAIAVPVTLSTDGLPLGVQLIGRAFDEEALFAAGSVVERQFGGRRPPADDGAGAT